MKSFVRNPKYPIVVVVVVFAFISIITPFAAAQGKIAFVSTRDGNQEIYVMNDDGSNQVRLTNSGNIDNNPSFNLSGTNIAFVSGALPSDLRLRRMNSDGTGVTLVSPFADDDLDPSFTPDGSKIVYASNAGPGFRIVTINFDGTDLQTLVPSLDSDFYPSYSKDGTRLIFERVEGGFTSIWGMDASGTNLSRRSTISGASDFDPSFSPDGSKIVFRSNRDGNDEIYLMNFDGSNPIRLTDDAAIDQEPVFSPDGTKIAFASNRGGNFEIYLMNADGTDPVPITATPGFDNFDISWVDPLFAPPTLTNITVTPALNEGEVATLTGSISSLDPSLGMTLTVHWGDSPEQVFNYPAGTTSFSETHQYLDNNPSDLPYAVNLTLSTANGSDSEVVFAVVNNLPPGVAVFFPPPAVIGTPFTHRGIVSDFGILDEQTININWGDGSPDTTFNLAAGVSNFSANHTYAALGVFTVTVSATDDDGGVSSSNSQLVGVVPPPTSGKIAFTSNFGGNDNIWLMNSNGTGRDALTTNPASDSYPDLSTDGSKIVFVSDRDGNPEIYVMNAAGAFQTRLTNTPGVESEPVFSPDGSKIVFSSTRDGAAHEIYIMNADGSGQTRLTTNTEDDGQAEFSPDGTKIIFARLAVNQSDAHIYTMDLKGANQTALTSGSFVGNGFPSFSPDGQKIVFSSVRPFSGHTDGEIYVMDANGANQVRLTTVAGNDLEPAFSPDGSKIAFRSERDGNAEIYIMDTDGTDQQRITFDGAGVTNFAPSWSDVSLVTVDIPDNLAAEQGATLTVPVIVSDTSGKGILSYDFALNYDPAVLQPQTASFDKTGTLSAGFEVNAGTGTPGRLIISGFGTAPLSGAGTLLNLKFNVIGTPPTSSSLVLNPFMFNEGIPFAEVSPGNVFVQGTIRGTVFYGTSPTPIGVPNVMLSAIGDPNTSTSTAADGTYVLGGFGPGSYTVTPAKSGDVNGITALDASLISQFLVGTTILSPNQQAAAEVSGNGTITSFDAALVAQYVVGLPDTANVGFWRFVPASRVYPTVGNMVGEDYSAILMGEVSGNWAPGSTVGQLMEKLSGDGIQQVRPESRTVIASLPLFRGRRGQSITIPISIEYSGVAPAIQAYQLDFIYDPNVIQPEPIPVDTAGTLSSELGAVTNGRVPGRLRLAVYGSSFISSSGTLINLKFRVIGRNAAFTSLAFNNLMFNEGMPAVGGKNGKLTVLSGVE